MLGLFISALDFMIMTVALRTIADQLGGLSFQGWATSSYVIASTITAPLYGRLADRFGGRRIYMAALGLFLSGSSLCALSGSMLDLALWRAVKGLGGGGLMTLALTIMADMLSPELRTRYAAWSGVVFTTASLLGPAIGGFFAGMDEISGFAGWRWMFLINLPLGLLPLLAVAAFAPRKAGREGRPVDLAGAALMGLSVTPLLVALDLGMRSGSAPVTLGLMAVGLVSLALLVRVQLFKGDDALLPPRLFQHRAFLALNGLNITLGMALFVAAAVVPLYLQIVKGFPPTVAGLLLVPQSLMTTVAALLADRLAVASGRYRVLLMAALALLIFASIGWAFADRDSPIWLLVGVVMLHGAGMGMALQILLIAMQNAVPSSMLGLANGSLRLRSPTGRGSGRCARHAGSVPFRGPIRASGAACTERQCAARCCFRRCKPESCRCGTRTRQAGPQRYRLPRKSRRRTRRAGPPGLWRSDIKSLLAGFGTLWPFDWCGGPGFQSDTSR